MESAVKRKNLQVLHVRIRDFHGCIDINCLSRVIAMPLLTPTPVGPECVIGLLNYHGAVIPVVDLAMKLQLGHPDHYTLDTSILIIRNTKGKEFGLVVETVGDIVAVEDADLQQAVFATIPAKMINGAVKMGDYVSLLVNVEDMMDDVIIDQYCENNDD